MVTKTIDIQLPPDLEEFLKEPICIPLPAPGQLKITLPTGGTIKGMVDVTKSIPDDCSLAFSLVLPMLTLLANLECLVKFLKVVDPLMKVVIMAAKPGDLKAAKEGAEALPNLITAVPPLIDCVTQFLGKGMFDFVRDLLCLISKLLSCIVGMLRSIMNVLGGLAIQIQSAEAAGNAELLAALKCSQKNAQASAQQVFSALDPIMLLLSMAEPFLGMAGVDPIKVPAITAPEDTEKMLDVVNVLDELAKTLKLISQGMGGCQDG